MHKLMEYICDQMEEYEQKVAKDGKLSMAEIEYVDKLAHIKKNLLKAEEMWNDSEYSMAGDSNMRGKSNARRSYGRNQYGSYAEGYSMAEEDISEELKDLMHSTSDHQTRQDIQRMINRMR